MAASRGIPPTVKNFIAVMMSKLTQFDQKLAAKERFPNIYRLGHYLEAAHKIEADLMSNGLKGDEIMNAEIAAVMKASMKRRVIFNSSGVPDLPPMRNVLKQIDEFLTKGKNPSLISK